MVKAKKLLWTGFTPAEAGFNRHKGLEQSGVFRHPAFSCAAIRLGQCLLNRNNKPGAKLPIELTLARYTAPID